MVGQQTKEQWKVLLGDSFPQLLQSFGFDHARRVFTGAGCPRDWIEGETDEERVGEDQLARIVSTPLGGQEDLACALQSVQKLLDAGRGEVDATVRAECSEFGERQPQLRHAADAARQPHVAPGHLVADAFGGEIGEDDLLQGLGVAFDVKTYQQPTANASEEVALLTNLLAHCQSLLRRELVGSRCNQQHSRRFDEPKPVA